METATIYFRNIFSFIQFLMLATYYNTCDRPIQLTKLCFKYKYKATLYQCNAVPVDHYSQ